MSEIQHKIDGSLLHLSSKDSLHQLIPKNFTGK